MMTAYDHMNHHLHHHHHHLCIITIFISCLYHLHHHHYHHTHHTHHHLYYNQHDYISSYSIIILYHYTLSLYYSRYFKLEDIDLVHSHSHPYLTKETSNLKKIYIYFSADRTSRNNELG